MTSVAPRICPGKAAALPLLSALAPLLKGHVSLDRALGLLAAETSAGKVRQHAQALLQRLRQGASLSQAFAVEEAFYGSAAVAAARAGEASGTLPETIARLVDHLRHQRALRRRLGTALVYPAVLVVVAVVASFIVLTFVVPQIEMLLQTVGDGRPMPLPTRILLSAAHFMQGWGGMTLVAGVVAVVASVAGTGRGRAVATRLAMRLPWIGSAVEAGALARAMASLASMLDAGVPMPEGLRLAGAASGNALMFQRFQSLAVAVSKGQPLSLAMRSPQFAMPAGVAEFAFVGEESGTLPEQLGVLASTLEADATARNATLLALLEPALMVLMGLLVALVVAALFMPLVSLIDSLGS